MTDALIKQSLADNGYAVIPGVIRGQDIDRISNELSTLPADKVGSRRLLNADWCMALAELLASDSRLRTLLPLDACAVQCTSFVKTIDSNWLVSLHQDLSIPVAERIASPQWSGWSDKEGETFAQPPIAVLDQLVAVRLHLDDCNEQNGALRVVPGTHRLGRMDSTRAAHERHAHGERIVSVPTGGVMVMRPLLLHASSKISIELQRRVLHFVYGPPNLPNGARWAPRMRS